MTPSPDPLSILRVNDREGPVGDWCLLGVSSLFPSRPPARAVPAEEAPLLTRRVLRTSCRFHLGGHVS